MKIKVGDKKVKMTMSHEEAEFLGEVAALIYDVQGYRVGEDMLQKITEAIFSKGIIKTNCVNMTNLGIQLNVGGLYGD